MKDQRQRARELATNAIAAGRPTAWFDQLYQERAAGLAVVPWDDRVPNPLLVQWLDAHPDLVRRGGRALDVGCGTGDNAAELARRGFAVTAFDVSEVAVLEAHARFAELGVHFEVGDACAPAPAWVRSFDLVVEAYTLQVLPPTIRAAAATAIASTVAPAGALLVIARARDEDQPEGTLPWPLLRRELEAIAVDGLHLIDLQEVLDAETPPVRRFVATYRRDA